MKSKLLINMTFCATLLLANQALRAESAPADAGTEEPQEIILLESKPQAETNNTAQQSNEADQNDNKPYKLRTANSPLSRLVDVALKYGKTKIAHNKYLELHENYCRQARNGDTDAQYAIGWMYEQGKGVASDLVVAELFYRMAAEQEYDLAKASLARLGMDEARELDITKLPNCMRAEPVIAQDDSTELYIYSEAPPPDVAEQRRISDRTAALFMSQKNILKIVNKLAPRFEIDANLVMSFIAVESGFNAKATSPKNAQGLMQLIPATAARFGVKNSYKPEENIKGGLAYLQYLLAYYKGNVHLVAAAYNAGEGAVDKYRGVPPYKETRMYVNKILSLYNKVRHPYRQDMIEASPILDVLDLNARSSKRSM